MHFDDWSGRNEAFDRQGQCQADHGVIGMAFLHPPAIVANCKDDRMADPVLTRRQIGVQRILSAAPGLRGSDALARGRQWWARYGGGWISSGP
jgi:hypothetical protein